MKYMILDEETQIHKRYKRKANPFLAENYIVARGWKVQGDERCSWKFFDSAEDVEELHIPDDVNVIVAHNAKFELLYEMRFSPKSIRAFFKRGGKIWCTQYAEYLIYGQEKSKHMCALDSIVENYGGRKKFDAVKELWEAGVQTSDIDRDLLTDYLVGTEEEGRNSGDIGNTELIYLGQKKLVDALGMHTAVEVRMDGLCATSEMEFNGIAVDLVRARRDLKERTEELRVATAELEEYLPEMPPELTFNWNSGIHASAALFGGTIKYRKKMRYRDENGEWARKKETEKWPLFDKQPVDPAECEVYTRFGGQAVYMLKGTWDLPVVQDCNVGGKSKGAPKFRNVTVPGEYKEKFHELPFRLDGYVKPDPAWLLDGTTDFAGGPVYSTGSDTTDELRAQKSVPFIKAYTEVQRLTKEIGTYYFKVDDKGKRKGMLTCVDLDTMLIHHKLNHTSTVTSRLSSSDPNLHNTTRGDFDADTGKYKSTVKAMFVSRFGAEGSMGEIDYSQLEVVVMGLLSLDKHLCEDLRNKVDFHCKRVSLKNSVSYEFALDACKNEDHPEHAKWKKERTKCKIFSFQRAYGAGAKLIAAETGMEVGEVEDLIKEEDRAYPGVVKFNERVAREVGSDTKFFSDPTRGFRKFRKGHFQTPTGTLYTFRTYDAKDWQRRKGITDTFMPTELKNYPVQGMGGEIVQMVLGMLWRHFIRKDNYDNRAFLVNTVHDCVWFDMHDDVVDEVLADAKKIMGAVPHFLKHFFDITSPVPFPVDVEVGKNMLELHHWEPEKER